MNWYSAVSKIMVIAALVFLFTGIVTVETQGQGKAILDNIYVVDSSDIFSISSNLAAVQIIEWDEGGDSMRVTVSLSPELDGYFLTDDFFDYIKFTRQIEEDIIAFDFFIEDAPAYWWKKFYSLKEKVKSEVFNLDFFVPRHFDVRIIEVNHGSLQTFNGFPSITQILLNQSVSYHHGHYWSLFFKTENSEVFIESATSLFLYPSHSQFIIFNCRRVEGAFDHSKVNISKARIIRLDLNYSTLAATYVDLFEESLISNSKIDLFFVNRVDFSPMESDINIWYLGSKFELMAIKVNLNIKSVAKELKSLKMKGWQLDARINGFCGNSFDYKVKASNSELQLFDRILLFDEEEMHQGSIEGHNKGGTTQIDLKLEDSKIRICSNSD